MPSTTDLETEVPELADDFDTYCEQVSSIRGDFFSLVDPSKHFTKTTGVKTFETLAVRIQSFEKRLGECERKLKQSVEKLEEDIAATPDEEMRKKKLLIMELQSKKMFIKIVKQHQKELISDKFYLMEEMQRMYTITEGDDSQVLEVTA